MTQRFSKAQLAILTDGAVVALAALVVMIGWHAHWQGAVRILPTFAPMQYNTALCALGCGIALILRAVRAHPLGLKVLGGMIAAVASLTFAQYLTGANFGIDELLMKAWTSSQASHPGRMAPNTALGFMLAGLAFFAKGMRSPRFRFGGFLQGWIIILIAIVSLMGYVLRLWTDYVWWSYTGMALHTTTCFLLIGAGILGASRIPAPGAFRDQSDYTPGMAGQIAVLLSTLVILTAGAVGLWTTWQTNDIRMEHEIKDMTAASLDVSHAIHDRAVGASQEVAWVITDAAAPPSSATAPDTERPDETWQRDCARELGLMFARQPDIVRMLISFQSRGDVTRVGWTRSQGQITPMLPDMLNAQPPHGDAVDAVHGDAISIRTIKPTDASHDAATASDGMRVRVSSHVRTGTDTRQVSFELDLDPSDIIAARQRASPTSRVISLVDNHGTIVPLTFREMSRRNHDHGLVLGAALRPDAVQRLQADDAPSLVLHDEGEELRGMLVLTRLDWADASGPKHWVAVGTTYDAALSASFDRALTSLLVGGAFAVFSIFVGLVIARHVVRPISQLAAAARSVDQGVYPKSFPVHLSNETGDLARAFKSMVHSIEHRTEALELEITERERAERRFRTLLESAPDAIVVVGADRKIRLVNTQCERLFGYSREELSQQRLDVLLPHRYRAVHEEHVAGYFASPTSRPMGAELELFGRTKNGREIPVEISLSPIETESGLVVAAAVRDISRRWAAEVEAKQRTRDLETLLYVTSHDLREPLRAIRNFSRMIEDGYGEKFDERGLDLLRRIIRGGDRMNQLIEDVLMLSRAQRMDEQFVTAPASELVAEALRNLQSRMESTGATVRIAPDLPQVYVSRRWATQALYNLLGNALKFGAAAASPIVDVEPYHDPTGREVGVIVSDRGPGVAVNHRERIFDLFQRAVGRDIEGTGAGLAIVRQVAERHGGRAWVDAREGGGASFYITFRKPGDQPEAS